MLYIFYTGLYNIICLHFTLITIHAYVFRFNIAKNIYIYTYFYSKYLNQFYILFDLYMIILHNILTFYSNNNIYIYILI